MAPRLHLHAHEDTVRIQDVASEGRAIRESEAAIERSSRLKVRHGPCFQAEPAIIPPLRLRDHVLQEHAGDALAQVSPGRAHRFHLPMGRIEFLQGGTAGEFVVVPYAPKGDVRLTEALKVQSMPAFRW